LEFEGGLASRKVEGFERTGVVDVFFASEFVETLQADDFALIFVWHNLLPHSVRHGKIEFVGTFTNRASLPPKSSQTSTFLSRAHCPPPLFS